MKRKAMAHALRNDGLKSMIRGAGLPQRSADPSEVGVERLTRSCRRVQVARGRQHGKNRVEIVLPERLVNTMRAHVTGGRRKSVGQFALYIDVPLHHVITFRTVFGVTRSGNCRTAGELLECPHGKRT